MRAVESGAGAHDHGDAAPAFPLPATRQRTRHDPQLPLPPAPGAAPEEAPVPQLAPARLAGGIAATGDPTLLRVAAEIAAGAAIPLPRGAVIQLVGDDGAPLAPRLASSARLLVRLPTLGALEVRIRIDEEGVDARVLAASEEAAAAAKAGIHDLTRKLVRATGLRGRAEVAAQQPELPPAPPPPAPADPFDAYA